VLVERSSAAVKPLLQHRETHAALGDPSGLGIERFRD
jgi:hypothetical protein